MAAFATSTGPLSQPHVYRLVSISSVYTAAPEIGQSCVALKTCCMHETGARALASAALNSTQTTDPYTSANHFIQDKVDMLTVFCLIARGPQLNLPVLTCVTACEFLLGHGPHLFGRTLYCATSHQTAHCRAEFISNCGVQ